LGYTWHVLALGLGDRRPGFRRKALDFCFEVAVNFVSSFSVAADGTLTAVDAPLVNNGGSQGVCESR